MSVSKGHDILRSRHGPQVAAAVLGLDNSLATQYRKWRTGTMPDPWNLIQRNTAKASPCPCPVPIFVYQPKTMDDRRPDEAELPHNECLHDIA